MPTLFFDSDSKTLNYEIQNEIVRISTDTFDSPLKGSCLFNCILGILDGEDGKFLLLCTERELIGTLDDSQYYKITKVDSIPIECYSNYISGYDSLDGVKKLIESLNFYYTFGKVEEHFLWNKEILGRFHQNISKSKKFNQKNPEIYKLKNPIQPRCGIPASDSASRNPFASKFSVSATAPQNAVGNMFCGYFETQRITENGTVNSLMILSKISVKKIGTRMLSRGVDEQGKVSFFVETSFTVVNPTTKTQFIILRGSVPLFWASYDALKPQKITLENDYESNQKAFKLHFQNLQKGYGKICVVDLLGKRKYEHALSKFYGELCEKESIDYVHFDLNSHTSSFNDMKYKFQETLSNKTNGTIETHQSASVETEESQGNMWEDNSAETETPQKQEIPPLREFKRVFRVNCMDCLDRTNIAQYLLFTLTHDYNFKAIKSMWANNGNALSRMYTGSNALKSEFSSKGKISVLGMMNDLVISANRMINNKFTDKEKQQAIDLLLGKNSA